MRNITSKATTNDAILQKMQGVLDLITLGRDLPEILARIAALVEKEESGLVVSILTRDETRLRHAITPHLRPALRDALIEPAEQLLKTWCPSSKRIPPFHVSDIASDPLWNALRPQLATAKLRFCCTVPMLAADGAILGLFQLHSRKNRRPSRHLRGLLQTAGKLAVLAIEQKKTADQLIYQTQYDSLTHLPNRSQLSHHLRREIARVRRHGRPAAVLFIDMDRFTLINETLGHTHGDHLLQDVARRLQDTMRETDTLVRMGGDVFVMIASDLTERRDASHVAQRLLDSLKEPFLVAGREVFVTMSVGISLYPDDGADEISLQKNAETAMHKAKTQGGNRFQCYTPQMNQAAHNRLEMEGELRRAIRGGELLLHYQPQFDRCGALAGMEALVRWNHPQRGLIPPVQFIPVAEASGLIVPLGAWVLHEACRQNAAWQTAGHPPVKVAVNVSAMQFMQGDFLRTVADVLKDTSLEARWLELEITESMLMHSGAEIAAKLQELRNMGISVALDDFGTGYASMTYLQNFPIDTLKIDRTFVNGIDSASNGKASEGVIIKAITSLATSLGMHVVAEGVETEQQRQFLLRIGCSFMQGYLYSPPLPPEKFELILHRSAQMDTPPLAISA